MASPADVRAVLDKNRADAIRLSQVRGQASTLKLLRDAQTDLEKRLAQTALSGAGKESFTYAQLHATLRQVKHVQQELNGSLKTSLSGQVVDLSKVAAEHSIRYLVDADVAHNGIGTTPLGLNEARMVDRAAQGSQASLLRRLASSGKPASKVGRTGDLTEPHPARVGILQRYGMATVGHFENILQQGLITKKSVADMRDEITEKSPFLKGAPRFWAERIVRTELMGAYNRGAWETTREADEELGDCVKILVATFDARTAADSYAVHGQIRRPTEAFETWEGMVQHPPARPNDRETVVTHRVSWPLPPELTPKSGGEIHAAWKREGRKGSPPAQPLTSTVPRESFGHEQPRPKKAEDSSARDVDEKRTDVEQQPVVEKPTPTGTLSASDRALLKIQVDGRGYPIAGAVYGKMRDDAMLTHAVDWDAGKVLCGKAKFSSFNDDEYDPSITDSPTCTACQAKLARIERARRLAAQT